MQGIQLVDINIPQNCNNNNNCCCPPTSAKGFTLYIEDTTSIHLEGRGTKIKPLKASIILSPDADNILEVRTNGVYAKALTTTINNVESGVVSIIDQNGLTGSIDSDLVYTSEWGGKLLHNTDIDQDGKDINFHGGNTGFKLLASPLHTITVGNDLNEAATFYLFAPDASNGVMEAAAGVSLSLHAKNKIFLAPNYGSLAGQIIIYDTPTQYVSAHWLTGGTGDIGEIGLNVLEPGVSNEFYFKASDHGSGPSLRVGYMTLYDKIKLMNIPHDAAIVKIIGIDANNNVRYINVSEL